MEEEEDIYAHARYSQHDGDSDEGGMDIEWEEGEEGHVTHVAVPTQKEIEEMLVRRRKKVRYLDMIFNKNTRKL